MSPRLVVITVNYCCAEEILEGLEETLAQLEQAGSGEVWIVDNCSPDESLPRLCAALKSHPGRDRVRILESNHNGGFGYGNNIAIRTALAAATPPDYFYFLNPDAVPRPGAIAAMRGFLDDNPDAGVVGGLLCDEADKIQTSMFRFPSFLSEVEQAIALRPVRALLGRHAVPLKTPSAPMPVDWVAGTSFMVRRAAFEAAGLFDETFFLYWEETELCHRIKAAGFGIYGIPSATVMHMGGVSTGMHDPEKRIPPYWYASRNNFFRKTGRGQPLWLLNMTVACCLMLWRLHQALRRRPTHNPHFVKDFIRYSFGSNRGTDPRHLGGT